MSWLSLLMLGAPAAPFAAAPLADSVLAAQRGGFRLPSGIDIALTVQTQTAVNGAVVLSTVFRADQGAPSFAVYAPKAGTVVASARPADGMMAATMPTVTYDRAKGLQVIPGAAAPTVAIAGAGSTPVIADGLEQVAVGDGVVTDNGRIVAETGGAVQRVAIQARDLIVTHFAGAAFGSAIANSGSDRAIDTTTTVAIDLGNAGPDVLGSSMFRVEGAALDALRSRLP